MSNIWSRLDTLAGSAVNRTFSENVLITPRTGLSDYIAAGPDASRPAMTVAGVPSFEPDAEDLRGQRNSGDNRGTTRIANSMFSVQIMAAVVATIPYELMRGDRVDLADRGAGHRFAIDHVDTLDCGDLVLHLTKEIA